MKGFLWEVLYLYLCLVDYGTHGLLVSADYFQWTKRSYCIHMYLIDFPSIGLAV